MFLTLTLKTSQLIQRNIINFYDYRSNIYYSYWGYVYIDGPLHTAVSMLVF